MRDAGVGHSAKGIDRPDFDGVRAAGESFEVSPLDSHAAQEPPSMRHSKLARASGEWKTKVGSMLLVEPRTPEWMIVSGGEAVVKVLSAPGPATNGIANRQPVVIGRIRGRA